MATLVFTICAKNYIGLSRVLEQSVRAHGRNVDFRIYVAEGFESDHNDDPTLVAAPEALADIISPTEFVNMAFMYSVTEFCTAIKAACFMHGFTDGYDHCIYMDPDIFVTADLCHVTDELERGDILITPHLCLPSPTEGPRADRGILATGVYNLGFLALRRSEDSRAFLEWWHERLRRQAFNDGYQALYTDQRWMDFGPSLFPARSVRIWRHLGCNVAPWNYHERRIDRTQDGFVVRARHIVPDQDASVPLLFLHFSGFDFRAILDGRFDQLNLTHARTHDDLIPLYDLYGAAIRTMAGPMAHHLATPYGFDVFADGSPVLPSHRRLFRVWRERHGDAVDPFATGKGSFHAALSERGLLGRKGKADMTADKATVRNVSDPAKLMARAQRAFRLLFRLLGRTRFFFLVRSLNRLSHIEQHYDTFALDEATIATMPMEHRPC